MDTERWARLRALFDAAVERPAPAREAWVRAVAADDPALVEQLVQLLRQESQPHGGLSRPAVDHIPDWEPERLLGQVIGDFSFESVLGRGGMGVVYRAEQRSPRRTVALKTLSNPITSAKERRRFRLEIEVLGLLQHRAIAQVYDAGTLEVDGQGIPFVAMELVVGARDLSTYAREMELSLTERLALFREACEGVQHAHRRGIVHRDLKPGNLLVDESGQVKVIDFGLARVQDSRALGVSTVETIAGSVMGTLEYMSPEHVSGESQEIDVRSDVYSLGCVLFELLVGRPPRALGQLTLFDAIQQIQSKDISPPRTVPRSLRAVLMKCLARDPLARYATAAELAADLGRHERGESVLALRGHALATLANFSRRHRALFFGAAAVIAALSIGLVRANWATRNAVHAKEATRDEADAALEIAQFLGRVLSAIQPFQSGRDVKVIEVLSEAQNTLGGIENPRARATVRAIIGEGLLNLGELERAETLLDSAVRDLATLEEPDAPARLLALAAYADLLEQRGRYAESLAITRATLPLAEARLGDTVRTTKYLRTNLAVCLVRLGSFEEARDVYRESLERGQRSGTLSDREEVATRERFAQVLMTLGALDEAALELDTAQRLLAATGGGASLTAIAMKSSRATLEQGRGNLEEALRLQHEVLDAYAKSDEAPSNTVIAAVNCASWSMALGRLDEAREVLHTHRAALERVEPEPGRLHSIWWTVEGFSACQRGDFEAARRVATAALALGARLVPTGWPEDHHSRRSLACAQWQLGDLDGALATLRAGLDLAERLYGVAGEPTLQLEWRIVFLLVQLGRPDEAETVRASALGHFAGPEAAVVAAREAWTERFAHLERAFLNEWNPNRAGR